MIHAPKQNGFTLVELMLAMLFVSVLLLSIALTAIQVGRLYNRGMVLRSVNQVGRDVSDTLRRDFLQASAGRIVQPKNGGSPVIMLRDSGGERSGRVCLGDYSYVWNLAPALNDAKVRQESDAVVRLDDPARTPITLARVIDKDGALCRQDEKTGRYLMTLELAATTQLLKSITAPDEVVVAVYQLQIERLTRAADGEQLYRLSFVLGTSETREITIGGNCKPPDDDQSNIEFCAINNFEMIVRTNG